jgi:hypothetical protein
MTAYQIDKMHRGGSDVVRPKKKKAKPEEHKRCPFCGQTGWPVIASETPTFNPTPWIRVRCQNINRCKAMGPLRKTERGAWAAWDKRV